MKAEKIFFLHIIAFLFSCTSGDKSGCDQPAKDAFYTVSLEKALDDAVGGIYQTASLSKIGGSISYIPLELTDKSAFQNIRSITMYDSSIFISDMYRMLEFTNTGKFVRQFGRQGKGPEEYIYAFEMVANDTFRWVRVNNSRCYIYNPEGKFIKSVRLDSLEAVHMLLMNDKMVIYCGNKPVRASKNPYSLFITDLNFNVIKSVRNHYKRTLETSLIVSEAPFYTFQENVRFQEWGCDTLYTVYVDSLVPHARFDLGKRAIPYDVRVSANDIDHMFEQYSNKVAGMRIFEDTRNFYLNMGLIGKSGQPATELLSLYALYSKQTGDTKIIGESGFQNDIDGGLSFFPRYVYNDSILVDWVDAYDLREKVLNADASAMRKQYGQKFDALLKLAKSLNDESGQVLVMVRP